MNEQKKHVKKLWMRVLIVALCLVMAFGTTVTIMASSFNGDLDGDGKITSFDAQLLAEYQAGNRDLDPATVIGLTVRGILDRVLGRIIDDPTLADGIEKTFDVKAEEGIVTKTETFTWDLVSVTVPEGAKVTGETLTITVKQKDASEGGITLEDGQELLPLDIHVEGVAADNTAPIIICVAEALQIGLNLGNVTLYHVENGVANPMAQVMSAEELTAHNQFYYDPVTGDITVSMATFSEVTAVTNSKNAWNGEFDDFTGSGTEEDPYIIANADQLAYMSKLVSDDTDDTNYAEGYYKLIADINMNGDYAAETDSKVLMFYPIGYWKLQEGTNKAGEAYYGRGNTFTGVFDGNGNTISNIYQNTWLMDGTYDYGYWNTAMGLFGAVYNATIKNLTLDNFQCDGETAPVGCIATYAGGPNMLFENIQLTNSNPRTYNVACGGIAGYNYNSTSGTADKITFRNITVDQTNKITALWGSYGVSGGSLLGRLRENSKHDGTNAAGQFNQVIMENCHMATVMDMNNDCCSNYQWFLYCYAGMVIGTVDYIDEIPGVGLEDVVTAKDCTVTYGDWNRYWYCELVKNTIASYTHDHQFGRLTEIDSLSEIQDEAGKWNQEGGFVTIDPETGVVECYHIFKHSEGYLYRHFHDVKDETNLDVYETTDVNGDGVIDSDLLKEDHQRYFIPFNQLFIGYNRGCRPVLEFKGIKIVEDKDSTVKSAPKFKSNGLTNVKSGEVKLSELVDLIVDESKLSQSTLSVFVSPVGDQSTADASVSIDIKNWANSTLTFTGKGEAKIVITDYFYCTETVVYVGVNTEPVKKFETKFTGDFLYRVGNINEITLSSLFKASGNGTIIDANVNISCEVTAGAVTMSETENTTWDARKIKFEGTGVVKLTITDNDYCTPTELYLEVVNATNATSAINVSDPGDPEITSNFVSNDVVLLNDIGSGFTVADNYTVYGNGFTLKYTADGRYLNNGLKKGVVAVKENGTLDNLRIEASIYPRAYMYYNATLAGEYVQSGPVEVDGDKTRYYYQLSGIAVTGNATISNCYVYGGRANIFVDTGNVTIQDTVLECSPVANIQIQSNDGYTVTLTNVTTIQYPVNATVGETENVMMGAGVIVGPDTTTNPTIVLNGHFKQYNWVTQTEHDVVTNETAQMIIEGALAVPEFSHTINGKAAANLGIIYMNEEKFEVVNNTNLPYVGAEISLDTATGQVYSLQNATEDNIYSDYENADNTTVNGDYVPRFEFDLGDQAISYDGSEDTRYLYGDKTGVTALYQDGDAALTLDLTKLATIYKYTGIPYAVTASCKDPSGNVANDTVTLSAAGTYTLIFTVEDTIFYDVNGQTIEKSITRTFTVLLTLTVKEANLKNATVSVEKTALDGVYTTVNVNDYKLRINFLDCISITDYDKYGNGTTVNLSQNISSATLTPASVNVFTTASTITITYTDGRVLTVNLSKISGSSPGTKTATVNTSGGLYFITDGALNNKPTEASSQNKCTITSVSYKGNSGSVVTNDTDVTVTWALGSSGGSTPCVTPDTLIMLADGSQVRVDALTGNEELLVWNHNTGKLEAAPVAYIVDHEKEESLREITHLYFSDGSDLKIIGEHVFFDATLNKYVTLDENAADYIGHTFLGVTNDSGALTETKLTKVVAEYETTTVYEVVTYQHLTCFTNGILSASAYMDKLLNIFDINPETLAYTPAKVQADIETYGLYTYADFEGLITEEAFELYNAKYLKIAVGKGYITWEDILDLIDIYFNVNVQPLN